MTSCILTVIKNEQDYLDEWIKYHLDLGINHIFILEDIGSLTHREIVDRYPYDKVTLLGVFDILDERGKEDALELKRTRKYSAQRLYFKEGLCYIQDRYPHQYDWCFLIDDDEFITFEKEGDSIDDILSLFSNYDAFILQWKLYGANGHIEKPDYNGKGVVDTYTEEAKGRLVDDGVWLTKTCYNLNTYRRGFFMHHHQPSDLCRWCATNFTRNRTEPIYDNVYLRHYITRSWEEYVWKYKQRGYIGNGSRKSVTTFFDVNPDLIYKRRELLDEMEKETLVVLPYVQGKSQGKELQLALNGWHKFCRFNYHFVVIGEFDESLKNAYPWVEFMEKERAEHREGQYNPHLDIISKFVYVMEKYESRYDGFIYMVDDNYAIKPFSLSDIMTTHYLSSSFFGNPKEPTYFWRYDKWKTRQLLDKENLPHVNYTTHFPYYMEFSKLRKIIDKYNLLNESYVFDDIYFNHYPQPSPVQVDGIRLGIWDRSIFNNKFKRAVESPNIKFICNSVEGWSKELEDGLGQIIGTI